MEVVVRGLQNYSLFFLIGAILSSMNAQVVATVGVDGQLKGKKRGQYEKCHLSLPLPQSLLSLNKSFNKNLKSLLLSDAKPAAQGDYLSWVSTDHRGGNTKLSARSVDSC